MLMYSPRGSSMSFVTPRRKQFLIWEKKFQAFVVDEPNAWSCKNLTGSYGEESFFPLRIIESICSEKTSN